VFFKLVNMGRYFHSFFKCDLIEHYFGKHVKLLVDGHLFEGVVIEVIHIGLLVVFAFKAFVAAIEVTVVVCMLASVVTSPDILYCLPADIADHCGASIVRWSFTGDGTEK
jgi:hypothetical protein